jgi:hypothetical protein
LNQDFIKGKKIEKNVNQKRPQTGEKWTGRWPEQCVAPAQKGKPAAPAADAASG